MSFLQDLLGSSYKEGLTEDELSKAVEKAMTAKEKAAESELTKMKNAFNKASSEVADYKKRLQEKQSDEEKKASEQAELLEQLRLENEEFKKQSAIAQNKAQFAALGLEDELAASSAEALYGGDMKVVFDNLRSFKAELEKGIRADVMKNTPTPPAGGGSTAMTKDEIMNIRDSEERQLAIAEHPELFGM